MCIRPLLLPILKFSLTLNSNVSFWKDPWVKNGCILANLLTAQDLQQSGIGTNAKAINYITDEKLCAPNTSNHSVNTLWRSLANRKVIIENEHALSWCGKPHSIRLVYNHIANVDELPACIWVKVVWTAYSTSSDNVFLWRAINKAMKTRDKLIALGMNVDDLCVFCNASPESVDHILFECSFLVNMWMSVMNKAGVVDIQGISSADWNVLRKATRWRPSRWDIVFYVLKVYIRNVWLERNTRCFKNVALSASSFWIKLMNEIKCGLRDSGHCFSPHQNDLWG